MWTEVNNELSFFSVSLISFVFPYGFGFIYILGFLYTHVYILCVFFNECIFMCLSVITSVEETIKLIKLNLGLN